jgi:hypothetical protein
MFSAATVGTGIILGLIGTSLAAKAAAKKGNEHKGIDVTTGYNNENYLKVMRNLQDQGFYVTEHTRQIRDMYDRGLITEDDYKNSLSYFEKYKKLAGKDDGPIADHWNKFIDFFKKTEGTGEQGEAIRHVAEASLHYMYPNANNIEDWLDTMASNAVKGIDPPNYQSMLDPNADLLPVPEAKWYTGQEMADLFGINYDPNYYYDLLKKSTEAQVAAQNFKNEQAIANSMADDTVSRNQYLQAIDNTKADAVIKGSTLGARMANELLANANAANTYATNQANVFNQAMTDIQPLIQKNALAKETANKYFNQNVFTPIGENIEKLYYDDIVNRGAYLNYNADQIAAALEANGQIAQANAAMDAAYQTAKTAATADVDTYRYLYDLYKKAAPTNLSEQDKVEWARINFNDNMYRNNPNNMTMSTSK